jgi:hypothetical protein
MAGIRSRISGVVVWPARGRERGAPSGLSTDSGFPASMMSIGDKAAAFFRPAPPQAGDASRAWRYKGVKFREFLGGRPDRDRAKIIDGNHQVTTAGNADENPSMSDLLPIPEQQPDQHTRCRRNILVAVNGSDLDRDLITLAGKVAGEHKDAIKPKIFAVFGIEVPRTQAIDDDMPEATERAHVALNRVADVAARMKIDIEQEIVQSRHFGHSLVDEVDAHDCAMMIYGQSFAMGPDGHLVGFESLEHVLLHAACKVWVVRGVPPEQRAEREAESERSLASR